MDGFVKEMLVVVLSVQAVKARSVPEWYGSERKVLDLSLRA